MEKGKYIARYLWAKYANAWNCSFALELKVMGRAINGAEDDMVPFYLKQIYTLYEEIVGLKLWSPIDLVKILAMHH